MSCISTSCIKQNCGKDPSQLLAGASVLGGLGGAPYLYFVAGEPISAGILGINALTNGILGARVGCMAPWYQLGHKVEELQGTILSLNTQLDRTKQDLQQLQEVERKLKDITKEKERLEVKEKQNLEAMQHLSPQLQEERTAAEGLVHHLSSVFREGQEDAAEEKLQVHKRDEQIATFRQTTDELHITVTNLARTLTGLQTWGKQEETDPTEAQQLLSRIQELIAVKKTEELSLSEITRQLESTKKIEQAFEAQTAQLEAVEKRLLARRRRTSEAHEPISNEGRSTMPGLPPKTVTTMQ